MLILLLALAPVRNAEASKLKPSNPRGVVTGKSHTLKKPSKPSVRRPPKERDLQHLVLPTSDTSRTGAHERPSRLKPESSSGKARSWTSPKTPDRPASLLGSPQVHEVRARALSAGFQHWAYVAPLAGQIAIVMGEAQLDATEYIVAPEQLPGWLQTLPSSRPIILSSKLAHTLAAHSRQPPAPALYVCSPDGRLLPVRLMKLADSPVLLALVDDHVYVRLDSAHALEDYLALRELPLRPGMVRVLSLLSDQLAQVRLEDSLGERFLPLPERTLEGLERQFRRNRGGISVLLAHNVKGELRWSWPGQGSLSERDVRRAAKRAGTRLLLLTCDAAEHYGEGPLSTLYSRLVVERILEGLAAPTLWGFFHRLSGPAMSLVIGPRMVADAIDTHEAFLQSKRSSGTNGLLAWVSVMVGLLEDHAPACDDSTGSRPANNPAGTQDGTAEPALLPPCPPPDPSSSSG
jgi:hypothetical protein